jgi:hypothetical protein
VFRNHLYACVRHSHNYLIAYADSIYLRFFIMSSSTSATAAGVCIPTHNEITGGLLRQLEHAAQVTATSTDNNGEFYNLLAMVVRAEDVQTGSVIVVPLDPPADHEALDFTFVARSKALFITVFETPQARNTYGHVAAYSTGTDEKPFPVGTLIMFATPSKFVVAKWRLVFAIRDAEGAEVDLPTDPSMLAVAKRPRRLLSGGETGDDAEEKQKGTYLLDLDGVKHFSRNKTDLALRERELHFVFRAMDTRRRDFATSTDYILQTEAYRSMITPQTGDTPTGDRHEAFESCGILGRVPLLIFQNKEKIANHGFCPSRVHHGADAIIG